MDRRTVWWPVAAGLVMGTIAAVTAAWIATDPATGFTMGAPRFVGAMAALFGLIGYYAARRLVSGVAVTRTGYTLSYRAIEPTADGYREMREVTVADLIAAMARVGYRLGIQTCNDAGVPQAPGDPTIPLAGANVALIDARVRGRLRLHLVAPRDGGDRALGVLDVVTERGDAAEEMALFALRALDGLVGGMEAARDTSRLGGDPVALLVSGLPERPRQLG